MSTPSADERFQPDGLARKVLNLDLAFHWLPGADRFWFRREHRNGALHVLVDAESGAQAEIEAPPPESPPEGESVPSPDGSRQIIARAHDLWIEEGSGGEERITFDGEPGFAYADPELRPIFDKQAVARRRGRLRTPISGVFWSPDGRFVVALRRDLREIPERPFVTEFVPPDGFYAVGHSRRFPLAGDVRAPDSHLVVFDVRAKTLSPLQTDPQALNDYAFLYAVEGMVWWDTVAARLFLVTSNRGGSRYGLCSVDLGTGAVREVLEEKAPHYVRLNPVDHARPNVHVLASAREVVWYSERSGQGHLYLHDSETGRLKRQVTDGDWAVFDLLRVDERERVAYFTACDRDRRGDPYYRYLYRIPFDGGEAQLLTPEKADHRFANYFGVFERRAAGDAGVVPGSSFSPSGRFFVDSYSTTDRPPEYVLRRRSGELVAKLLESDASELYASGWQPPERVVAQAADGRTDLHGVITRPQDFDPSRRYPIIDAMYPGPQGSYVPRSFVDLLVGGPIHHLQTFAGAGFVVVTVDGRGTAHRSRAFRDAFMGSEDVFGAADHVAAIRYLAADRPYMDLERVGVLGQSFGGYGSLRAMLLHPEFFKVAVSATGPDSWLQFPSGTTAERYFGDPTASSEARAYYDTVDNRRLVSRLRGKLLLVYGGIDENVPLKHAFALIDALVKADRDFDLLLVPESAHAVPRDPYVVRRSVDYFVEHLLGERSA